MLNHITNPLLYWVPTLSFFTEGTWYHISSLMQRGRGRVTHMKLLSSFSHLSMVKSMTTLRVLFDYRSKEGKEGGVRRCG